MSLNQQDCSTIQQRLRSMFDGNTGNDTDHDSEAMIANHLDHCEACRQQIDQQWYLESSAVSAGLRLIGSATVEFKPVQTEYGEDDTSFYRSFLSPSDDPRSIGRIGNLEISGLLGHGGAGVVFKGYDPSLGRWVAVKIIDPAVRKQGDARSRFLREARAMAAISHPHVVPVHAVAEHRQLPYLVMEYVAGGSLDRRLQTEGNLSLVQTIRIGIQVASGLAAAHRQGVVHRDIKPANILLDPGVERVRVADFGLARGVSDATQTQSGTLLGTPNFMSPEQVRSEPMDGRSDLFSLGSVLYLACTGHHPFPSDTIYGSMQKILTFDPPSPSHWNSELPTWLDQFINRLMAKSPADRFAGAQQVVALLEAELAYLQQPENAIKPDRSWFAPTRSQPKRHTLRSYSPFQKTIAALMLIGVGFGLAIGWNHFFGAISENSIALAEFGTAERPNPVEANNVNGESSDDKARVDSLKKSIAGILNQIDKDRFSGNVLVAYQGKTIAVRSIGEFDPAGKQKLNSKALFEIASITKVFASTAVMMLVEQGQLELDDPIAKFLPGVPDECKTITVRHLLQHRSGMPGTNYGKTSEKLEEIVASFFEGGPQTPPGQQYEYWNQGFMLVGQIVAKVSGKSFEDFVRDHIFKPSGMKASCFVNDPAPTGFSPAIGSGSLGAPRSSLEHPYGGDYFSYSAMGGLVTNVSDLAKFNAALSEGKLLSEESIQQIIQEQGLGWRVDLTPSGKTRMGMGGRVRGFISQFRRYPETNSWIIVLANRDDVVFEPWIDEIESLLVGDAGGQNIDGISASLQTTMVGDYWTKEGRNLVITQQSGRLNFRLFWSPGVAGGPETWGYIRVDAKGEFEFVSSVETIPAKIEFSQDGKSLESIDYGKDGRMIFTSQQKARPPAAKPAMPQQHVPAELSKKFVGNYIGSKVYRLEITTADPDLTTFSLTMGQQTEKPFWGYVMQHDDGTLVLYHPAQPLEIEVKYSEDGSQVIEIANEDRSVVFEREAEN